MSANIRGLTPAKGQFKKALLRDTAETENVDIIVLTESHLNDSHLKGEVEIEGFENYRSDRAAGVIVYVKRFLIPGAELISANSIGNIEYLVLHLKLLDSLLITIYRPPNPESADFKTVMGNISKNIEDLSQYLPRIILTGDLNFPSVNWDDYSIESCNRKTREQARMLLDLFENNFREQYIDKPTRVNNILDIFATNDHELVNDFDVICNDQRTSDH